MEEKEQRTHKIRNNGNSKR